MVWIVDFVTLKNGAYHPGTQAGKYKVTILERTATTKVPERASRMEFAKSCVVAVLSVEGADDSD